MSRSLLLCRPKLQNNHFLFCTTEVDPMSRLMSMSQPYESTPVTKNFTMTSFQLVLATFNAHLMCSNSSISVQITPTIIWSYKRYLKGRINKVLKRFFKHSFSTPSKSPLEVKEAFISNSPTPQELIQVFNHLEGNQKSLLLFV